MAWLPAVLAVAATAALLGYDPLDSQTWVRWDSFYYLDIARDGYELAACTTESGVAGWCGDAGWFPAYPWLVRGLHEGGLPLGGSAVAVSWLLAGATIVLLWATLLRRQTGRTLIAALLFAAFAPGQIYSYSVFPMSLLTLALIGCLWFLYRGRWVVAGGLGALAVLAHPVGLLLVPVSAAWLLAERSVPIRERLRRVAVTSGLMGSALLVLALDQWLETGRWNAYYLVQDKYAHGLQNPLASFWNALSTDYLPELAVSLQIVLVTVVLAAVVLQALIRRGTLDRLDGLLLMWVVAAWIFPFLVSTVSIQRAHAAMLPVVILVAKLPGRLLYAFVALAMFTAVVVETAFLYGSLV